MKSCKYRYLLFFAILFVNIGTSIANVRISIYAEKSGNSYTLFADNLEHCHVSMKLNFVLNNMRSSVKNNEVIVVPPQSRAYKITTLNATITHGEFSYSYDVKYTFGDVTIKQFDSDYIYSLPYKKGKKIQVSQGYYGKATHEGINALDFKMPVGTSIFAARGGVVFDMIDTNSKNCFNPECEKYNNYILICHKDGTLAQYSHLDKKGVKVKIGQKVEKGDLIGVSGNTGYSSGPHLHFSVYLPRFDSPEYVQTYFKTKNKPYIILKEKKYYKN